MKICIIAHYAYGALTGEESGHIGGVERQTALLSEWLVKKGHDVTVVTWNEGDENEKVVKGIRILKICKVTDGLPIIRFFSPRWTSLIKALKEANAELYYHNCAEYVTGQIAFWAKNNNKAFIYTVASDADCENNLPKLQTRRDRLLFLYGLRNANNIICQTHKQSKLLKKNYSLNSIVIPMPSTPPKGSANRTVQFSTQKVIWVGRIQKVKRIEWLLDIAEALPDITFDIIGPDNHNPIYASDISARANLLNNINFVGKISRKNMPEIYKNAAILLNTSIYEGFPNTFLEAWSYGVPVVSTVDPDSVILRKQLGFSSTNKQKLIIEIEKLLKQQDRWQRISINAYEYYIHNHEIESVQEQFEKEFLKLSYNTKTQLHFNEKSSHWSDYYKDKNLSISHIDLQVRANFANKYLNSISLLATDTLIDVGCGTGDTTIEFQKLTGCNILAVDFAVDMIKQAQRHKHKNISFEVANATSLPYENHLSSVVISLGTLEYIPDYKSALNEFNRVLNKNGKLILSVPNHHSIFRKLRNLGKKIGRPLKRTFISKNIIIEQEYHKMWKQKELYEDLKESGFIIEKINYFTYGLLNPKLVDKQANIFICNQLNKRLNQYGFLAKYLAHSTIILAKK